MRLFLVALTAQTCLYLPFSKEGRAGNGVLETSRATLSPLGTSASSRCGAVLGLIGKEVLRRDLDSRRSFVESLRRSCQGDLLYRDLVQKPTDPL